jgi:hypothetical protein
MRRNPRTSIVELAAALCGATLVICTLIANQQWLDRHFLPSFFLPRHWYVAIETTVRVTLATVGVAIAIVARSGVGRIVSRAPGMFLRVAIAAALALVASEFVLRHVNLSPTEWLFPEEEPRRQPDPQLGWILVPARTGRSIIGGRVIEYTLDSAGDRVSRADEPVDRERPTILFVGESVMFGEGLTWDESVPAQVGRMLGIQSANLAVHGYSNDQAYLRLQSELPRFRRPIAVVSLFMTNLFGRNLDDDRPHLGPGLTWQPAQPQPRLAALAGWLVPYRTDQTVERGVAVTREVLRATAGLARARGAQPLVVVPHMGAEDPSEQTLRHRVFDGTDVPAAVIEFDPAWRLPWDRHPDARGAHAIAIAIAEQLRPK